jgi:chemotaxis protein methyltransferase CheR
VGLLVQQSLPSSQKNDVAPFGASAPIERSTVFKKQFGEVEDGCLAQAMVDTVCEPLIVLEKDLRVIAASRSFT